MDGVPGLPLVGLTCAVEGSCCHLTGPATTCDAQAARSGLGVRQERGSHHSHHSQRPQNPEWVRMSLGTRVKSRVLCRVF